MPTFKQLVVFELPRKVKSFLRLETGVGRGNTPKPGVRAATSKTRASTTRNRPQAKRAVSVREQLVAKAWKAIRSTLRLTTGKAEPQAKGVKPENIIWIFGSGRTGSSWLSAIMNELQGHARWNEPYAGDLFGMAYYVRVGDRMRNRKAFILGNHYKEAWLDFIRNFVLDAATIRFGEVSDNGYLVVKEPNGSVGAPLLLEALPESRMIFLVRDPRDVVSSILAAHHKGSWGHQWEADGSESVSLADIDPDEFVRQWSTMCMLNLGKAQEAYDAHVGPKVIIRYEDLRAKTLETMKRLYAELGITVDVKELARAVEKHAWENVPEEQKGADKPRRKAKPGSWQEDLTLKQASIIEEVTAPILNEFYPSWSHKAETSMPSKRELSSDEIQAEIARVENWYHRIEVAEGIVTPGFHDSPAALEAMEVPEHLDGKRLLDVGARDGYFSFIAEQRGAEVLAIESVASSSTGFATASSLLGSSVEYRRMNVYDLSQKNIGMFDMIFFLDEFYHLRDPMLALERLWEVARPGATMWVESHVIDRSLTDPKTGEYRNLESAAPGLADIPIAQFYPQSTLVDNIPNWWSPNLAGLKAMVESAGFEVARSRLIGTRGLVVARKSENAKALSNGGS